MKLNYVYFWGTWVTQSVKHVTLDFSSGHDLTISEIKPYFGLCTNSAKPAWDSLSLSLSISLPLPPPPALSCAFSLTQMK